MYQANVYTVMVASPGDVAQEREIAREVIQEWNDVHSRESGIVLLPLLWENNTRPDMGDRPQALINKQMVEKADILVAMFWTRLGSSTGVYASGTVEEITEHSLKARPTMLYFSNAPINPSAINRDQYEQLMAYKGSISNESLYFNYKTADEFRVLFARHLAMTIHERPEIVKLNASSGAAGNGSLANLTLTPEMEILLAYSSQSADGFSITNHQMHMEIMGTLAPIAQIHHNGQDEVWLAAIDTLQEQLLWKSKDGSWSSLLLTETGARMAGSQQMQVITGKAKKVLKEAIATTVGEILALERQLGLYITINGKNIIENRSRESLAAYRAALHHLVKKGLIEKAGTNSYMVTDKGYQYGKSYHIDQVMATDERKV